MDYYIQNFDLVAGVGIAAASIVVIVSIITVCVCVAWHKSLKQIDYTLSEINQSFDDFRCDISSVTAASRRIERHCDAINQRTRSRNNNERRRFNDNARESNVSTDRYNGNRISRGRRGGLNNSYGNSRRFSSVNKFNSRSETDNYEKETVNQNPINHDIDSVADYN